jgi:hypothetical protein
VITKNKHAPKKELRLKHTVDPAPYKDTASLWCAIMDWQYLNESRKANGYLPISVHEFCKYSATSEQEINRIMRNPEWVDMFAGRFYNNSIMFLSEIGPRMNQVLKQMMDSDDPKDKKEGVNYYLKWSEQLNMKNISRHKGVPTSELDSDAIMFEVYKTLVECISYACKLAGVEEEWDAIRDRISPINVFEKLKQEGRDFQSRAIQEEVVEAMALSQPDMEPRKDRPGKVVDTNAAPIRTIGEMQGKEE